MSEIHVPTDRIDLTGDLTPTIERVCEAYGVGALKEYGVIKIGYEDCNVVVETDQTKLVAKIFAATRTPEDISRYTAIMQKVVEAGVSHPALLTTNTGKATYSDNGVTLVLMQFVEGKTFLELDRSPTDEERRAVLEQAAKINKIDYRPPYLFDDWAIPNIHALFDQVKPFMPADDLAMVGRVIRGYNTIPVSDLPHSLVHGDLTKVNVIKGEDSNIYIIDFSVANWYPRIQELAVVVANLLHDDSEQTLEQKCATVAREYTTYNYLTDEERKYLPAYALAGMAMELMGSYREKFINGNDTQETSYWLSLGQTGLQRALSTFTAQTK